MSTQPTVINTTRGGGYGTLGAIVRDRQQPARLYALTAGHVLAADRDAAAHDVVSFFGAGDAMPFTGMLTDWVPNFVPNTTTTADAAIARVEATDLRSFAASAAAWPTGIAEVRQGEALRLLTHDRGPIDGIALDRVSCPMALPDTAVSYMLQGVRSWHAPGGTQPGDSGAPVWNDDDKLVGIHVGTEYQAPDRPLLIPIYRILEHFQVDLVQRGDPLALPASMGVPPTAAPVKPAPAAAALPSTPVDADTLARTLWGEARGEGEAGMRAVAFVVLNRAARRTYWGATVGAVCRKPYQFSCWNATDPNLYKVLTVTPNDPQFRQALDIAVALLADARGLVPAADPTGGATHYHARGLPQLPRWAVGHTACARIGRHVFYNDIG